MIGLLVTGHGHFADGVHTSANMIAGENEYVRYINFEEGMSTEQLAEKLAAAELSGHPGAAFVIGSSYGLSDRVKTAAHLRLSLSSLTLPHKLARLVLAEAVYRAGEIRKGTKYHK